MFDERLVAQNLSETRFDDGASNLMRLESSYPT